jgi:hypothetical protein
MKSIVMLFGLMILSLFANAQIPDKGSYVTNTDIDKFEGTWKWEQNGEEIVIKLKKVKHLFTSGYYEDVLVGCHSYSRNGIIIESSMNDFNDAIQFNHRKRTLLCWGVANNSNLVQCRIWDITRKKSLELRLTYLGGLPLEIKWELERGTDVISPPAQIGETMPLSITLIKQ